MSDHEHAFAEMDLTVEWANLKRSLARMVHALLEEVVRLAPEEKSPDDR